MSLLSLKFRPLDLAFALFLLLLSGTLCVADGEESAVAKLVRRLHAASAVDKNGSIKSDLLKEVVGVMNGEETGALAFAKAVLDIKNRDSVLESLVMHRFLESTLSANKETNQKWLDQLGAKQIHNPLFQFDPSKEKGKVSLKAIYKSFHQAAAANKVETRIRAIMLISGLSFGVGKTGRSRLLQWTHDPVAEVRAAALASLFSCGVGPVMLRESALHGITDKSEKVRSEAVLLIGGVRNFDPLDWDASNDLLRRRLHDESPLVRMNACGALTGYGFRLDGIPMYARLVRRRADARFLPDLAKAIRGAQSGKIFYWYFAVLNDIPTCNREMLLANLLVSSKILKPLSDETQDLADGGDPLFLEDHQLLICYLALKTPPKEARVALPLMRSLRGEKDVMTRVIAASGLLHVESSTADRQWAEKTIYAAVKKKRKPRMYDEEMNPYKYLQYLSPEDEKVVKLWQGAFTHPSHHVRLAAITTGLKWKKKRQDAGPLIRRLLKDSDPRVRLAAVRSLRSFGDSNESLVKVLIGMMMRTKNKSGKIEFEDIDTGVFNLLQEFGPAAAPAIPILVRTIQHKSLLDNGGLLYYMPEKTARVRALLVLAAMGKNAKPALPAVLNLLKRPSIRNPWLSPWHNRERAAMQALAAMGEDSHEAVPLLIEKLRENSPCLRLEAARTLGAIGSHARAAIPVLRKLAPKSRPEVRQAINAAIKQINDAK